VVSHRGKKNHDGKKVADRLRSNMAEMGLPQPKRLSATPKDKDKMSEILTEFIGPYAGAATTEKRYRTLISVAVVAWNASLFPASERGKILDSIIDNAVPYGAEDMKLIIHELIRRKERHFSHINRLILSYDVKMTKDGSYLSVASSP